MRVMSLKKKKLSEKLNSIFDGKDETKRTENQCESKERT